MDYHPRLQVLVSLSHLFKLEDGVWFAIQLLLFPIDKLKSLFVVCTLNVQTM